MHEVIFCFADLIFDLLVTDTADHEQAFGMDGLAFVRDELTGEVFTAFGADEASRMPFFIQCDEIFTFNVLLATGTVEPFNLRKTLGTVRLLLMGVVLSAWEWDLAIRADEAVLMEWFIADLHECAFDDLLANPAEFAVSRIVATLTVDLAIL